MNNLRFATAIHILVLTEKFQGQLITSDFIAGSINVNPVVVRREIKFLKEAGFIDSKKGKEGGCFLVKNPNEILLGDVYKIMNQENVFGRMNQTNPECPVGKQMNANLEILFHHAETDLIKTLNHKTLKEFSDEFQ
ncbi:Rrf2 family transcriptional regulator [Empedobacter brevis]|uniref:Rrf2 family transcriptional regulator n=2 Tax=Empedobacter brevis TaxID=247 RepID=A0A511NC82_9FLAO|nr:Rrf2 family transcriptional regulator [Empedobacter brevis]MDM1071052.1 Rrf2 family transcriptional regulator [Empedobacter brevis]QES93421.1 Rrf2 family transcriptional regulator [Empedobacter brevis]QHC85241.1 Rrf2 family transcriptional regulator [Empedobacter brevis]GEM50405.1 Rrf2 family transcriptional regulator [Empedobacter brevis NBRC 14943 = ATCC 43319]